MCYLSTLIVLLWAAKFRRYKKNSSYMKVLTKRCVDYLEKLGHDFWEETLLLRFLNVFEHHNYIWIKADILAESQNMCNSQQNNLGHITEQQVRGKTWFFDFGWPVPLSLWWPSAVQVLKQRLLKCLKSANKTKQKKQQMWSLFTY